MLCQEFNTKLQCLPQILARHRIMNRVINKGKVRADGDLLAHQILILGFRQREQCILLFLLEQITTGIIKLDLE